MAALFRSAASGLGEDTTALENLVRAIESKCSLLQERAHGALLTVLLSQPLWQLARPVRRRLLAVFLNMSVTSGPILDRVLSLLCDAILPKRPLEDPQPCESPTP